MFLGSKANYITFGTVTTDNNSTNPYFSVEYTFDNYNGRFHGAMTEDVIANLGGNFYNYKNQRCDIFGNLIS